MLRTSKKNLVKECLKMLFVVPAIGNGCFCDAPGPEKFKNIEIEIHTYPADPGLLSLVADLRAARASWP
eukprot:13902802-Heterocapsa_arctica.AAC.1